MNKLGQAAAGNWPAIAWTVGPSSAVAGLAMHAAGQYGDVVALGALGTAGTAGVLALASLSKKWSETFSWASGALSLAALHAGVSALSGPGWPTLYSWVISSGLSFAAYLAYRHHTHHDSHHLDRQTKMTRYQTDLVRLEMARFRLEKMATAASPVLEPVLVGHASGRDPLAGLIPYVPGDAGSPGEPISLGPNEEGQDTLLKILDKHTLILGTTGNGKSNIVNLLILRLVRAGCAVIGIDMKKGVELDPIRPLLVTLAETSEQARDVLDWVEAETDRRAEIMKREGVRKWSEDLGPYIFVVTDELSELTQKRYDVKGLPKLPELLDSCLRINRAFGIHFISATQAPSKQAFGGTTDGRANYKVRISTQLEEAAHAQFAFGPNWKGNGWDPNGKLLSEGEFLISSKDNKEPIRRKAQFVRDEDLASEVVRLRPYKIELDGSPWAEDGVPISVDTRVHNLFKHRGELTRQDIEEALGLEGQQVRDAIKRLRQRKGVLIEYNPDTGTYWLASEGAAAMALAEEFSE